MTDTPIADRNDRDELARLIEPNAHNIAARGEHASAYLEGALRKADAIIAAGWTPPMSEREHAWGRAAQERITREQGKELPEEDGH